MAHRNAIGHGPTTVNYTLLTGLSRGGNLGRIERTGIDRLHGVLAADFPKKPPVDPPE